MHRAVFVALTCLAIAAGCDKKSTAPNGTGSGSGTALAGGPPEPIKVAEIFVGDEVVAQVDAKKLADYPRLDSLLPEENRRYGSWESITVVGGSGGPQTIEKPADTYRDLIPVLYPAATGASFGLFDPVEAAKKGAPKISHTGVREIRIAISDDERGGEHGHGGGAPVDPTKLVLTISTPSGDKQITGAELVALPREKAPTGDNEGWRLTAVLDAVGIEGAKEIVLTGGDGTDLKLTATELDPAKAIPFLKLNRQGQIRFRVYTKQGTGWSLGGDLRALAAIKVLK
jgi:hypothetical protein